MDGLFLNALSISYQLTRVSKNTIPTCTKNMAMPMATAMAFPPCQVPSWVWTFASESPWILGFWRQRLGEEEGTKKREGRQRTYGHMMPIPIWSYDDYICIIYIYTCHMCLYMSFYGHMMPIRLYATKNRGEMCGMCDMAKGMNGPQIP